jgi:hypothetical protein
MIVVTTPTGTIGRQVLENVLAFFTPYKKSASSALRGQLSNPNLTDWQV